MAVIPMRGKGGGWQEPYCTGNMCRQLWTRMRFEARLAGMCSQAFDASRRLVVYVEAD